MVIEILCSLFIFENPVFGKGRGLLQGYKVCRKLFIILISKTENLNLHTKLFVGIQNDDYLAQFHAS